MRQRGEGRKREREREVKNVKIGFNRGAGFQKERNERRKEFRWKERARGVPIDREGGKSDSGTIKELVCKWMEERECEGERNSSFSAFYL